MALGLRVRAWLARQVAAPDFQRRAIASPLTRLIARRQARKLFSLASGFVSSQVLLACLRSGLLDALHHGGSEYTPEALAARLDLPAQRLSRLLDAAAALSIVAQRDGGVVLGPLGAALLGNPAARAMIEHHDALYHDLADPLAVLRGRAGGDKAGPAHAGLNPADGRVAALWGYAGEGRPESLEPGRVAAYSELMTRSQEAVGAEILAAVSLSGHRQLLDVGGGEGEFAAAAVLRYPGLRAVVFDLPGVSAGAQRHLRQRGVAERVAVVAGSFLRDPLPRGADVITLVRVLHDHDDAAALQLLQAVRAALPPGGRVIIAEPFAGREPALDAYFAAYFLAMGQGRLRSQAAVSALLRRAGFVQTQGHATRLALIAGVVSAWGGSASAG